MRPRAALNAGVDMETPDGEAYLAHSGAGPRRPSARMAQIDDAVRRILRMKFESGLFEHPYVDAAAADRLTATPDAIALAREAAGRAMVLLQQPERSAAARRVAHPPHGRDRHPCARHADRRL